MGVASARRDHLVETALGLFYRDGFHATGIDTILAESGVANSPPRPGQRTRACWRGN